MEAQLIAAFVEALRATAWMHLPAAERRRLCESLAYDRVRNAKPLLAAGRLIDCPACHGSAHDEEGIECTTCNGKGFIELAD